MSLIKDLFIKRNVVDLDKQDDRDWWKSPVLQGPENDYGEYDYLATQLPESCARWEATKWKCHCESCGKYSRLNFKSEYFFYTYDGYDSMSYISCWRCELKSFIHSKIKRPIWAYWITLRFLGGFSKNTRNGMDIHNIFLEARDKDWQGLAIRAHEKRRYDKYAAQR